MGITTLKEQFEKTFQEYKQTIVNFSPENVLMSTFIAYSAKNITQILSNLLEKAMY